MKNLVIAIDFDDTVVTVSRAEWDAYHRSLSVNFDGYAVLRHTPVPGALETLRELNEAGHRLVLWTCRNHEQWLKEAVDYLEDNGVELFGVNNRSDDVPRTKLLYDFLIDDRSVGTPLVTDPDFPRPYVDWNGVREILVNEAIL